MNILYFHQHFSTPSGATGIRSFEMARFLAEKGHSVTMVCGSYGAGKTGLNQPFTNGVRRGHVAGFEVVEFELPYSNRDNFLKRTWTFLRFAFRSIKLVFEEKFDLLFATSTPLTAALPGIVARLFGKGKFVFEVRDLWPELPRAMAVIKNPFVLFGMALLEKVAYHSAHRCIGLSPGICAGIKKRGISATKIDLIPNGCDLEIFRSGTPSTPPGIKNSDFVALYSGTHGIANGLGAVLNAAKVLKSRGRQDIKLVFVGEGKTKEELVSRSADQKLDNCLFLSPMNKIELAALLNRSNIGLMILANVPAFYYGTSPNKFFDYIAAGKPVLNNYPGWIADLITEWKCGYAIKPDDPEEFANTLIAAADNPAQLKIMGKNGHHLAIAKFNRRDLAAHFTSCLEKTVILK